MAWLSIAPVKSLRLVSVDAIELETTGVRGDRRFYLVDDEGLLVNAKRIPRLLTVRAAVEDGRLALRFADGTAVDGDARQLREHLETNFFGRPVIGRVDRHGRNKRHDSQRRHSFDPPRQSAP